MIQLTLTLKMTTAQIVKTSVTVNNSSPIQDYVHPDDQSQPTFEMIPGFKPFTVLMLVTRVNSLYFEIVWNNLNSLSIPQSLFSRSPSLTSKTACFKLIKYLLSTCFHLFNLNVWSSVPRKCYYALFMYIGFSLGYEGVLTFVVRSDSHIFISLYADKNVFIYFSQAEESNKWGKLVRGL